MRGSGQKGGAVADGRQVHDRHAGAAGRDRDRDRKDVARFVSPRLRRVLAAAEPVARDGLLEAGSARLRRDGPEGLEAVLSELLEELPGSFYPVYNAERERWELGIR